MEPYDKTSIIRRIAGLQLAALQAVRAELLEIIALQSGFNENCLPDGKYGFELQVVELRIACIVADKAAEIANEQEQAFLELCRK